MPDPDLPPCGTDSHRPYDWRRPAAYGMPGGPVCGVCHPNPQEGDQPAAFAPTIIRTTTQEAHTTNATRT